MMRAMRIWAALTALMLGCGLMAGQANAAGGTIAVRGLVQLENNKQQTGIYLVDEAGQNRRLVIEDAESTTYPFYTSPSLSRNAQKLAFEVVNEARTPADNSVHITRIGVSDANGTNRRFVTPVGLNAFTPALNSAGTLVAFAGYDADTEDATDYTAGLYVVSVTGTGLHLVTPADENSLAEGDLADPTWNPDGSRLAFEDKISSTNRILAVDADGTDRTILSPLTFQGGTLDALDPAWSPDGTTIAFVGFPARILLMNANGTNVRQIVSQDSRFFSENPTWRPDGGRLAFTHFRSVYTCTPTGSDLQAILPDPVPLEPGDFNADSPSWGSDVAPPDTTAPQVVVDSPKDGAAVQTSSASDANVVGRVADEAGGSGLPTNAVTVRLFRHNSNGLGGLYFNGTTFSSASPVSLPATLSGSGTTKTWTFKLPTTAQGFIAGRYAVQAVARDVAGNSRSSKVTGFTLRDDVTPPQVVIDVPANGKSYAVAPASGGLASGRVADNAGGSGLAANAVTVVLLRPAQGGNPARYFNGTAFASATPVALAATLSGTSATKNWSFHLPTTAQGFVAGSYQMRADARDVAGNAASSKVITFTLTP